MPSSVSQPLHKYSVILNNYRRPSDRFMAGGYAMEADKREQSVRWMKAMDAFIDRCGMQRFDALIAEADPTAATAFLREQLLGA